MSVRVVTDSASSLTAEECARLGVVLVPLHVTADGRAVEEDELLGPEFPHRLESMETLPGTSQPSPAEFAVVFERLVEDGHDVLAVLISAGMSGTVRSAELAADDVMTRIRGARIEVLDSRSNSLEEGFAVRSAAEAGLGGASLEECRRAAEETMRRTRFLFTPHSLEYLRRGGRISRASALLSVMLKIAPVLTAQDGTTGIAGVARGPHGAQRRIATLMRQDVERCGLRRASVQYLLDREEAERFAEEVVGPVAGATPVPLVPLHPVVGIHVGPAVGVVYETVEPLR